MCMRVNKLTKYIIILIILNLIVGILWFNTLKPVIQIEPTKTNIITEFINNYLPIIVPFSLLILMVAILNLIYFNLKYFKKLKINKKSIYILIFIFILALLLRIFLIPHMHNLYYDEIAYMDGAKHIANGKVCVCLENIDNKCNVCGVSYKSIGFIFFLATFYKLFGVSSDLAFSLISIIGSLSVILIFILVYLIWKNTKTALISSFLLSIYPLHLRWGGSASAEIFAVFFILLTFIFLLIYLEFKNNSSLILSILLLIFTISIKEELFFLIIFFLIPLFFYKNSLERLSKKKGVWIIIIISLLILPYLIGTFFFHIQPTQDIGDISTSRYTFSKNYFIFSFDFLIKNALRNFLLWFSPEYNLVIVLILSLFGMVLLFKKQRNKAIYFLSWPIGIILLFSAYLPQPLYDSDVRHYISLLIPLIIFAAYSLKYIFNKNKIIFYTITGLIIISLIFHLPYLTSKDAPVVVAQEDFNFIKQGIKEINKSCLIITPEAYILDYLNRNSMSTYLINDIENKQKKEIFNNDCVYYYEGVMCYYEIPNHCRDMHKKFNFTLFLQKKDKGLIYSFYKLE